MSKRCSAKNRKGQRCSAWSAVGKDKCALHLDPQLAARMGSKHGYRKAPALRPDVLPMEPPKTAGEVRDALANTMVQVQARQMDARTANTLAYLAMSLLRAIEVSEIEDRLDALAGAQSVQERTLFLSTPQDSETKGEER
jgi:hypothetical protein